MHGGLIVGSNHAHKYTTNTCKISAISAMHAKSLATSSIKETKKEYRTGLLFSIRLHFM